MKKVFLFLLGCALVILFIGSFNEAFAKPNSAINCMIASDMAKVVKQAEMNGFSKRAIQNSFIDLMQGAEFKHMGIYITQELYGKTSTLTPNEVKVHFFNGCMGG